MYYFVDRMTLVGLIVRKYQLNGIGNKIFSQGSGERLSVTDCIYIGDPNNESERRRLADCCLSAADSDRLVQILNNCRERRED